MDEHQSAVAVRALNAAYDGTMDFPAILASLISAGFESYAIDYRRGTAIYYLPSGDSVELVMPADDRPVAAVFDAPSIKNAIRDAQSGATGYSYKGFCQRVKDAGCAGYMVSFPGTRFVYFGRTAETHVEHFPD